MDRKPKRAPFKVGDHVRYTGNLSWYEDSGLTRRVFGPNMVGLVINVRPGYQGTLRDISEPEDDEPVYDTTRDAYCVVEFSSGVRRAVDAESAHRYKLVADKRAGAR